MQAESMDEGSSTGISLPRMAGVVVGDSCGSKIVAGMAVISPLFCKVTPSLMMDWGIGYAVVETSLMSDSAHGAAISCSGLFSER